MRINTLKDLDMSGQAVLLRTAWDGDFGLQTALPTINYLAAQKAKIIIFCASVSEHSAQTLADALARKLLAVSPAEKRLPEYAVPHVFFLRSDLPPGELRQLLGQLRGGNVAILENPDLGQLPKVADFYLNDDFSSCRLAAPAIGKMRAAAGFGFAAEVAALTRLRDNLKHPFVVLLGGDRIADKLAVLQALVKTTDAVLLGGALANLFLQVRGLEIGKSAAGESKDAPSAARQILRDYSQKIRLPVDVIVSASRDGPPEVVAIDKVKRHQMIFDIGPATILEYSRTLKAAATLFWCGPVGHFETRAFSHGTFALARVFAARTKRDAFGVAAGGETLRVIAHLGLAPYVDHLSPGGPAVADFLANKSLPQLEALEHA